MEAKIKIVIYFCNPNLKNSFKNDEKTRSCNSHTGPETIR